MHMPAWQQPLEHGFAVRGPQVPLPPSRLAPSPASLTASPPLSPALPSSPPAPLRPLAASSPPPLSSPPNADAGSWMAGSIAHRASSTGIYVPPFVQRLPLLLLPAPREGRGQARGAVPLGMHPLGTHSASL